MYISLPIRVRLFCDPTDCSPPGSSVHGTLQARILEWVAIFFSRDQGIFPTQELNPRLPLGRGFFTSEPLTALILPAHPLPQPHHFKGNFPRQPPGGSIAWCHRNPLSHRRLWMGADTTSDPHDPPPFGCATPSSPQKSGLEKSLPLGAGPRIQE